MAILHGIAGWAVYSLMYLSLVIFVAFVGYCLYVRHIHQKYDHIPGPPRDSFLFGNAACFAKSTKDDTVNIHDIMLEWAEKYGPVCRMNSFHKVFMVVTCPEAIKEFIMSPKYPKDPNVYKRMFHLFGQRFLGNGLVTVHDHDFWYKQRRIMDPAFSSLYLRGLMSTFNEMADRLMVKLEEAADSQMPTPMHQVVNCFTLDVIAKVAFGVDIDFLNQADSPIPNAIALSLKGLVWHTRNPTFQLFPGNWKAVQEVKDAVALLRKTGAEWINERRKAVQNGEYVPKDILTQILKSAEEHKEDDDDEEIMIDNFVTFFIAGQETTANQLAFAIMELGRHPEILIRLKEEVDEVIGTKQEICYEDLGKLTYMSQVLKETLRLYPTATGTNRWVDHDTIIDGIKVPGGFTAVLSSYVSSRLDKFFKDPLKFDPERFSANAPKPYYCYFPFSLGPRSCLGQNFAQMEAKVMMAKLLQRFDFSLVPGQSFDILDNATLRPRSGVVCMVKNRGQTPT